MGATSVVGSAANQVGSAQPSNVNTGVGGKGGSGAVQNPTQNPYARQNPTNTAPTAPTSPYSAPTFSNQYSNNNPYANQQGAPGGKGGAGVPTQGMVNAAQGQGFTPQQWQAMQGMSPDQRNQFMSLTNQNMQMQQPNVQPNDIPTSKGGIGQTLPQGLPGMPPQAPTMPTATAPAVPTAPIAQAPIAQAPTLATAPVIPPLPVKPVAPAPVIPTTPVAPSPVQQRKPDVDMNQRRPEMEREQKRQDDRHEMEKRRNVIAQPSKQQELQRGIQTIGKR